MSILIFIFVLVVLIVVHELGHFIVAKMVDMRVDEFGLGYPPRALVLGKKGETLYTLNWLPFGGFVKIFGENSEQLLVDGSEKDPRAFTSKNRLAQAFVLVAGVAMNLMFAYVLITGALIAGTPRALTPEELGNAKQIELAVGSIVPGSPAASTSIMPGDSILGAKTATTEWRAADPKSFSAFVDQTKGAPLTLTVKHNGKEEAVTTAAKNGLVQSDPGRYVLGLQVGTIGVVPLSPWTALTYGAQLTWDSVVLTAEGLGHFFFSFFTFSADLSQVSGPVGIAGVVGAASGQGIGDLLSIMAIISINLALINLIPIPALDGGRLLFVIIESIIRRPIRPAIAYGLNAAGFVALVLLMVVVTVHDIYKLFI